MASPVIQNGKVELNALLLESHAKLIVEEGAQLLVYRNVTGAENDNLQVFGSLLILDEAGEQTQSATAMLSKN